MNSRTARTIYRDSPPTRKEEKKKTKKRNMNERDLLFIVTTKNCMVLA